MIVYLYDCSCDNHRVDKSAYLTQLLTLNGSMREEQDISNPSIVLELPISSEGVVTNTLEDVVTEDEEEVIVNPDSIPVFNYVFIPSLRRYYFVTAMSALPSAKGLYRLFRVSLRCDVLMSFKNDFMDLVAMVERNEFKYDPAIKDLAHPFKDSVNFERTNLSGSNIFNINGDEWERKTIAMCVYQEAFSGTWFTALTNQSWEAYLDLLGQEVEAPSSDLGLKGVNAKRASPNMAKVTYLMSVFDYYDFMSRIKENQKTFIKSVFAFPCDLEEYANKSEYWIVGTCGSHEVSYEHFSFSKTGEFSKYIYLGSFTFPDYDYKYDTPLSIWNIYVPFMGKRELDFSLYAGKTIDIYLIFSLEDGTATIYLLDEEGNRVESVDFNFGHRVGVDSSNSQEVENNRIAMGLNGIIGTLGNALSIVAGVATENPFMIASGAVGETKLVSGIVQQSINNLPQGKLSQQSPSMGMTSPMTAYIERVHKEDVLTSPLLKERYAHLYGLPLNKPYRLSNLTGFTKVLEIHLEGLKCTEPERESIYNALRSGVIL